MRLWLRHQANPPHNSANPPTPRVGGSSTQPPTGSGSPASTWGTSRAMPTAKASATVTANKDDAAAADQVATVKLAGSMFSAFDGGFIQTTSG